jgi:dTDP-4-amino-4,6-dideoxygalactose transaminase
LTNNGPQHQLFELALEKYLGAPNISLFCNGTLALQIACQALRLSGEVITTPFTFPATSHVLFWNKITPVFCDIEEDSFNLNPECIESLITPKTTAILPVHVFGHPCKVDEIQDIADRHGLRVIYDAAHCFAVEFNNEPIGNFGDASMFSFHATKIFHTMEGGALTYKDNSLKDRLELSKNFGIKDEESVIVPGVNAKMNEMQAAMGLLMLDLADEESSRRKQLTLIYRKRLEGMSGISFREDRPSIKHNYNNFVIKIDKKDFGISRDILYDKLKEYNIFTRKYFYPLCSQFKCYRHLPSSSATNLPVAEKVTGQVLSLPLYGELIEKDINQICDIIDFIHKNG